MVFSINANETSDKSFEAYKARAQATLTTGNGTTGNTPNTTNAALPSRAAFAPASLALIAAAAVFAL
jgi:hypothetical protein